MSNRPVAFRYFNFRLGNNDKLVNNLLCLDSYLSSTISGSNLTNTVLGFPLNTGSFSNVESEHLSGINVWSLKQKSFLFRRPQAATCTALGICYGLALLFLTLLRDATVRMASSAS